MENQWLKNKRQAGRNSSTQKEIKPFARWPRVWGGSKTRPTQTSNQRRKTYMYLDELSRIYRIIDVKLKNSQLVCSVVPDLEGITRSPGETRSSHHWFIKKYFWGKAKMAERTCKYWQSSASDISCSLSGPTWLFYQPRSWINTSAFHNKINHNMDFFQLKVTNKNRNQTRYSDYAIT